MAKLKQVNYRVVERINTENTLLTRAKAIKIASIVVFCLFMITTLLATALFVYVKVGMDSTSQKIVDAFIQLPDVKPIYSALALTLIVVWLVHIICSMAGIAIILFNAFYAYSAIRKYGKNVVTKKIGGWFVSTIVFAFLLIAFNVAAIVIVGITSTNHIVSSWAFSGPANAIQLFIDNPVLLAAAYVFVLLPIVSLILGCGVEGQAHKWVEFLKSDRKPEAKKYN